MEVHHHPEVEKKGFKEYILEGLMIFLAVFMGFIAESYREHLSEHHKETQYMKSMLADLRLDSTELSNRQKYISTFPSGLDTLASACNQPVLSDCTQKLMYRLNLVYLRKTQVYFTDKTASQLKYSDGMRLIKNTQVADAITLYWQGADRTKEFYSTLESYRKDIRQLSFKFFNYTYYNNNAQKTDIFSNLHPRLAISDASQLKEYGSHIWFYASGLSGYYLPAIQADKDLCINLIHLIRKQYDLE